ncbi:MAG: hypothetical protein ACK4IY_08405, partial [Chitinophagales bacterium]
FFFCFLWLFDCLVFLIISISKAAAGSRFFKDFTTLDELSKILIKLNDTGLKAEIYEVQNKIFRIGENYIDNNKFKSLLKDKYAKWLHKFKSVAEQLNIRFD